MCKIFKLSFKMLKAIKVLILFIFNSIYHIAGHHDSNKKKINYTKYKHTFKIDRLLPGISKCLVSIVYFSQASLKVFLTTESL